MLLGLTGLGVWFALVLRMLIRARRIDRWNRNSLREFLFPRYKIQRRRVGLVLLLCAFVGCAVALHLLDIVWIDGVVVSLCGIGVIYHAIGLLVTARLLGDTAFGVGVVDQDPVSLSIAYSFLWPLWMHRAWRYNS